MAKKPDRRQNQGSMSVSKNKPAPDFSGHEYLRYRLEGKPRDVVVVLAARAALRVAPRLDEALDADDPAGVSRKIILPVFRAMAVSLVQGRYRVRIAAATAIADAAATAGTDAAYAPAAARAAYAAAAAAAANGANGAPTHAAYADADADAAAANATNAAANVLDAVAADARLIDQGESATTLAGRPLWPDGTPAWVHQRWSDLERKLLNENPDWKVWTDWYRALLEGGPTIETLEIAQRSCTYNSSTIGGMTNGVVNC